MTEQMYLQALGLGLDPAWRRRTDPERHQDACDFETAVGELGSSGGRTLTYSSIGLEPAIDLLLWRMAPSVDVLETSAAALLRSGIGRWMHVSHSLLARTGSSQYVRKPTSQEQSTFDGERSKYLVVYPFTKSTEWYLLSKETRQGVMNEHMRVGHDYPAIRQTLGYSFGLPRRFELDLVHVGGGGDERRNDEEVDETDQRRLLLMTSASEGRRGRVVC